MKRGLLPRFVLQLIVLQLFVLSCTSIKPVINNKLILQNYQAPFKVFGIGYGQPGYNIITLTDAHDKYVVIKARQNNYFKVGDIYTP